MSQAEQATLRRSPCGERGLKFQALKCSEKSLTSLPVRGAWIEISMVTPAFSAAAGRSPCGERGLKLKGSVVLHLPAPVAPRAGSVD